MNESLNNSILDSVDLNKGLEYLTYISKTLTEKIVEALSNYGFTPTQRWAGLLLFFISVGILFLGTKVGQKVIKWILIGVAILLLIGILLPVW